MFGVVLALLRVVGLVVPGVTFFATERVACVGSFTVDAPKPRTIVINPVVGVIAPAAGVVLVPVGFRPRSAGDVRPDGLS